MEPVQNKGKILVVDDDRILLDMYKERLLSYGYEVVTATDGDEVLDVAKKELPDCILLDIVLPNKNGFDVLRNLRVTSETREIPVVLLTALVQESNRQKGMDEGADDFVLKSETKVGDVITKIHQAIDKRKNVRTIQEN